MAYRQNDTEEKRAERLAAIGKRKNTRKYIKRRQCAAVWKKSGERCREYAREDNLYCRQHGAKENGAKGTPEQLKVARARSHELWRRIKEATGGAKLWTPTPEQRARIGAAAKEGRRRKREGLPPLPKPTKEEKQILKADDIIVAEIRTLPAVPDKPFDQLEPHEQLVVVTGQALEVTHAILKMPWKDENGEINLKAAALVKDTALRTLGLRVKVDANALQARRADRMVDLLERIRAEKEKGNGLVIEH